MHYFNLMSWKNIASLTVLTLCFTGCSTDILTSDVLTSSKNLLTFDSKPPTNPEEHLVLAQQEFQLSNSTPYPQSLNHKLLSAEYFIKGGQNDEAARVLREILNVGHSLNSDARSHIFEARLALLKQDNSRAITHIQTMARTIPKQNIQKSDYLSPPNHLEHSVQSDQSTQSDNSVKSEQSAQKDHSAKSEHLPQSKHSVQANQSESFLKNQESKSAKTNLPKQHKIALLLPSQGQHAQSAKIIRDGFYAAYYKAANNAGIPNTQSTQENKLQIYDTSGKGGIIAAYEKAVADDVDIIVGPLTKPEVQSLAKVNLNIPVLALNTVDNTHQNKLFQFGLKPEDEVKSVAFHAYQQGQRQALIIAGNNEWSKRISEAFQYYFTTFKGNVVAILILDPEKGNLSDQFQSFVQSQESAKKFDMIFLVASPDFGREIAPLIGQYKHFNVPIYASASIYSGIIDPNHDQNLEGIRFCDMPCILNHQDQSGEKKSREGYQKSLDLSPRYFALGMDAQRLAKQLIESGLPNDGMVGLTGRLKLDDKHRIHRDLYCAKFKHGVPVPD